MLKDDIREFARKGDIEGMRQLLSEGVAVDERGGYLDRTALMWAVRHPEAVSLLIEHGADLRAVDKSGHDVLQIAVGKGPPESLALLLNQGLEIDFTLAPGYDPLADVIDAYPGWSCDGLPEKLKLLVAHGASLNLLSPEDEALAASVQPGPEALRLLLKAGADPSPLEWNELHFAVALGSAADVGRLIAEGADLSAKDAWENTPWLLSLKLDELEKARVLLLGGANRTDVGHYGQSPLFYAIDNENVEMLRWLIAEGFNLEIQARTGCTALTHAVSQDAVECARLLLRAGANRLPPPQAEWHRLLRERLMESLAENELLKSQPGIDLEALTEHWEGMGRTRQPLIESAQSEAMLSLLLEAGEDLQDIDRDMRATVTGLAQAERIEVSQAEFLEGYTRRFGTANPERMDVPFWRGMIWGFANHEWPVKDSNFLSHRNYEVPLWCYYRFGQSLTPLPDGRFIEIAGEHEDCYDPDFCIYNDVVVHDGQGGFVIYGYPEDVFPPTDFHSATLVGDYIYIVGNTGYPESRITGFTPVYRLHTGTLAMEKVETSGENPGWISRHKARLVGGSEIVIAGGNVSTGDGPGSFPDNEGTFVLDLRTLEWRRQPAVTTTPQPPTTPASPEPPTPRSHP